jgi:hypothetical protein
MLAFLEETIHTIQTEHEDISNCILILPSKRAGGFLKNYLRKHTRKTLFSPKIISIEEFIEELSNLKIIAPDELLIKSYEAYLNTTGILEKESFENYASWANALLNDFSEMDRYLVTPKAFFDYLSSVKTLEKWGVTNEQTPMITNYLQFWNHLFEFYTKLNRLLSQEQLGYQGMVYRKAAEDIEHYIGIHGAKKHFFIGFNALNTAEQHIMQELLETDHTDVFWDIDHHFYNDPQHSASLFVRRYLEDWKYYQNKPSVEIPDNYAKPKDITIVEAQNNMAQTKFLGSLLASYSEEKLNATAIVLADEALLIPVLYSLPDNVISANVTMGLSLSSFPSTSFFEYLLKTHLKTINSLYFKTVLTILNHPLSQKLLNQPETIVANISEQNSTYISLEQLLKLGGDVNKEILQILFGNWDAKGPVAIKNCRVLLQKLKINTESKTIEKLVWFKLDEVFRRITLLADSCTYLEEISAVNSLFTELAPTTSLDFEGDAYNGLQIMGVLETRGLDFENVILLSVNEGILPAGKSNASFITYDLKQQFGLPLYTEKDAVYTYHFYRLLQRVQTATLVYNSFSKGLNSGEKSRYLLQLEIEKVPAHSLRFEAVASAVSILKKEPKQIAKIEAVMLRLKEIAGNYFSPSALTNYVRNPMDFYYQKILKINETLEIEETVAYSTLGNVVHNALENLYKPFEGSLLEIEKLQELKVQIAVEVAAQFRENFREGDITKGKNLIIFEVAKRYVANLIDLDLGELKAGNTIKIIQLEAHLKIALQMPELDFPVFLGGKVDRIDLYNGQARIIDYKTGNVQQGELELADWDLIGSDYKYSKAFQVLAYALLIRNEMSFDSLEAGIISFKNMSGKFMKFAKREKPRGGSKETFISEEILNDFTLQLKKLILEICDPAQPFTEKEIVK